MNWRVELLLWASTVIFTAVSVVQWQEEFVAHQASQTPAHVAPGDVSYWSADSLSQLAQGVYGANPFRLERRPSAVRFDPAAGSFPVTITPPRPAPPVLRLSGILGGPPWQAVIEGIPGKGGSTLAVSDETFGDLRIVRVTRDSVIIAGPDTTWKLSVRKSW